MINNQIEAMCLFLKEFTLEELSLNLGNKNALKISSTGFIATSIQKPRLAMVADFVFYSVISR